MCNNNLWPILLLCCCGCGNDTGIATPQNGNCCDLILGYILGSCCGNNGRSGGCC